MSKYSKSQRQRRGAVAVLAAILMVVMFACIALSVDVGVMSVAKTDLQRAADAAAHAGVLEYATTDGTLTRITNARQSAHDWVERNPVLSETATVSHNLV